MATPVLIVVVIFHKKEKAKKIMYEIGLKIITVLNLMSNIILALRDSLEVYILYVMCDGIRGIQIQQNAIDKNWSIIYVYENKKELFIDVKRGIGI